VPPLVLVAVAWGLGLVAAHHWLVPAGLSPLYLILVSLLPLATMVLWRRDSALRLRSTCAVAFLLACLRYQAVLPDLNDARFVAHYNDQGWVTVEGVVQTYPDTRSAWTILTVDSEWIEVVGQQLPVKGSVLVRAPRFPEYRYGDSLRVSGLLSTPPELEGSSYRESLARKGVYSIIDRPHIVQTGTGEGNAFYRAIFSVRERARRTIARLIPDPEASLLQGILLGVRSGIPTELYDDFNATATSQIIVISGANIVIVSALIARVFGGLLGKRRATWFTLMGILLFVLFVGAEPPVIRSGLMGALYVVAQRLGRGSSAFVSLGASAMFLTILNPLALWDIGFQLSCAATLGLVLFASGFEGLGRRMLKAGTDPRGTRRLFSYVSDLSAITLAAQVLTTPLVVFTFGRLSLVAPLANLLISPVQPLIMSWGGAAILIGLVPFLESLARVVAWVPWLCLTYTTAVVQWMATWPMASLAIGPAAATWLVVGWGAFLLAVWLARHGRERVLELWSQAKGHWPATGIAGVLLAAALLVFLAILQLPDGRLHVAFLDVGQGDAILLTTPQGQQILVDGGPDPAALTSALGRQMPFWDRSIDLLVLTHADGDHLTGLAEALERYRVGAWLDNGSSVDNPLVHQCEALLDRAKVARHSAAAGEKLALGDGLTLEVLHPPQSQVAEMAGDSNNNSVVLRVAWNQVSFLLTGDVEEDGERQLVESGLPLQATVLKVAHHGSAGSSTAEFLQAVQPSFAVISVGADNRAGHPAPAMLDRLAQLGKVELLRTDERGTVEFITDGRRLWVRTER